MDNETHVFEIYTSDPVTGTTGWDIVWLRATYDDVVQYPNFDCIITTDDYPMSGLLTGGNSIIDFEVTE